MLQGIWKSLVNGFQGLFSSGNRQKPIALLPHNEPPPALEDADYEYLFMQLIEGVAHGWQQQRVLKFFDALEHRTTTEKWLAWLRRLGDRLLTSSVPNNDLATRMVQLGEIGCGEIGVLAYDIGMQLLTGQNPTDQTWDLDSPQVVYVDAEEMTLEQSFDDWNDSSPDLASSEIAPQQQSAEIDSPQIISADAENTTDVNQDLDPWQDSSPNLVALQTEESQQQSAEIDSPQIISADAENTTDVNQDLDPWQDSSPDLVSLQTEELQQQSTQINSPQGIYVDAENTADVNQDRDTWQDSSPDLVALQTEELQQQSTQINSPQGIYVDAENTTDVNQDRDPWQDSSPDLVSLQTEESQQQSTQINLPQGIYVDAENTPDANQDRDPWQDSSPDLVSLQTEESQEFSIDELLFMLEQNPALAKAMSEQLQINNTNPEAILEAFIQQLDKDIQAQTDESQN